MHDGPSAERTVTPLADLPLVSVVIGNWNRKEDLIRAIESVRNQVWPQHKVELIVVDNQSIDGSLEYCQSQDDVRTIVTRLDLGASVMMDTGFLSAKGKYIVCMDNDAELGPAFILNAVTIFESWGMGADFYPEIEMAPEIEGYLNGGYKIGCLNARMYLSDNRGEDMKPGLFREDIFDINLQFHGAACVFLRDAGNAVGWYNPDYFIYHNEVDMGARLYKAGYLTMYCPPLVATHYVSPQTRVKPRLLYYGMRHYYWFIWEHLPLPLAIYHTFMWFFWCIFTCWRYPLTFIRSHFSMLYRMPSVLLRRSPIHDERMTWPWNPNLKKEFSLKRWVELLKGIRIFGV